MIDTVEALGLTLVVVIPGAVATFGYERHVGPIGRDGTDRVLRYIFSTALLGPFSLIMVWIVWTHVLHVESISGGFRNRLSAGESLSPLWAFLPIPYLLVPWVAGSIAGTARNMYFESIVDEKRSERVGRPPTPTTRLVRRLGLSSRHTVPINLTGWDVLFLDCGPKLVAVRLKDGVWIAGVFGPSSFSSPPSASTRELVLESRVEVGNDGIIPLDELDTPNELGGAVRVTVADVDLLIVTQG